MNSQLPHEPSFYTNSINFVNLNALRKNHDSVFVSVIGSCSSLFIYLFCCCCNKAFWPKATYMRKGFIWCTLPDHSPSLRNSGQKLNQAGAWNKNHGRIRLVSLLTGSCLTNFLTTFQDPQPRDAATYSQLGPLYELPIKTISYRHALGPVRYVQYRSRDSLPSDSWLGQVESLRSLGHHVQPTTSSTVKHQTNEGKLGKGQKETFHPAAQRVKEDRNNASASWKIQIFHATRKCKLKSQWASLRVCKWLKQETVSAAIAWDAEKSDHSCIIRVRLAQELGRAVWQFLKVSL